MGPLVAGCTKGLPALAGTGAATRVAPTGTTAPVDPAAWALADRLTTRAYTGDTTAAMVAGLARSGIGTYADPLAAKPDLPVTGSASSLRLLGFQTHALAVGAWAGAGFTGAELDTVLPVPGGETGMPTTSELLAGYVAAADSPGGALARALMAGQNLLSPTTVRFPGVVLVLFAADLGADVGTPISRAASAPAGTDAPAGFVTGALRQASGGICSDATSWIEDTIVGFFRALRVATPGNLPGAIVVSIWNWLVGAAQAFVQKLIRTLTDEVLATIRSIALGVSTIAEQIASMLPYAVKVIASGEGGGATFRLGSRPLAGRFTASVSAGDLPEWPAVLADCAESAQIALPRFDAKGVPLTWGPLVAPADPLLTPTEPVRVTDVTDADGQASWGFTTSRDPGDATGEQRNQVDAMPVSVHRTELDDARARLTYALLGSIPDLLRPYAARLLAPYLDGLQARVNVLLDARGRGSAFLVFHAAAPPTPRPATSGSCSPSPVRPGAYAGTNTNTFTDTITVAGGGLVDHNDATGPVTLTVAADGSVAGSWSYHSREVADENAAFAGVAVNYHTERTWEMSAGTITGTVCNLSLVGGTVRRLTCTGACGSATAPAPQPGLPALGAPHSATQGQVTWRWQSDAADGTYSDTFTITVVPV